MFKLITDNNNLALVYGDKTIFKHCEEQPFITIGYQKLKYKSSHGSFKVKHIDRKKRVGLCDYVINDDCIIFSADNVKVSVSINETEDKLELKPCAEGNFENIAFTFSADKEEKIFGGGEQYRKLNLKYEKVINFVSEHIKVKPIVLKLLTGKNYIPRKHKDIATYSPMSTFVSSQKYALRLDTDGYGVNDFTNAYQSVFTYWEVPRKITYFSSDSFKGLSKKLNVDIPACAYLPDWVYDGMILGVQGGIERTMKKALDMKAAGAEICGIWCQDWSGKKVTAVGKQVYWNWEADEHTYPELKNNIKKLKEQGIHFLAYINPYLIKDGPMYNYCKEKNYLIKNAEDGIYHIKSTTFDAGMMDLTHPDMVEYLKNTIIKKNMLELGIDGYMADFGEYLPVDCKLFSGNAKKMHNIWPVLWAKINREAIIESGRDKEIFFFTRSGYNNVQTYTTVMWNGDQHTDYSYDYGMPCVIPASINLGLSGLPAVHSDIGGFISFSSMCRDGELFVRWMEMNTFSPLMRTHETIRPEKNAQYDDDFVKEYSIKLTQIHKLLKPYLKHCMEETKEGLPVIRAAFYEFNDMQECNNDYVYMLGSDIFVAPILNSDQSQIEVVLPKGDWTHIFTGISYSGTVLIDAPLGKPAVFYKTDSAFIKEFEKIRTI